MLKPVPLLEERGRLTWLTSWITKRLQVRFDRLRASNPKQYGFSLELLGARPVQFGDGEPAFSIVVNDWRGLLAVARLDETAVGSAYLAGSIDIEGDLDRALQTRTLLRDRRMISAAWYTYIQPFVFGQVERDSVWIADHYDEDADFYRTFLDETRCYSHAIFEQEDEPLLPAMVRKLDHALEVIGIQPGQRLLDIGGGWGCMTEYAGRKGIEVTSLTISEPSAAYIRDLIQEQGLPCRVELEHFLEYRTDQPFDAIVNLGVTEHLPDYKTTLAQYERLLKPGGRVYLDASAARRKFASTSFVYQHVFPGNATTLCLHDYLEELAQTSLELVSAHNDRVNYMLTSRHWALNLERSREEVVRRWGERLYRKFRLFHWGCVACFATDALTAYRLVLEKPLAAPPSARAGGELY